MLKQIELAAAVKDRLTDVNPNKDLPVALAIVESVKSWLKEIKNKFKGRLPNDIRSLYQGMHQAVSLADAKFSDVARVLGTSSRLLKEGRARFWAFIEGKVEDVARMSFLTSSSTSRSRLARTFMRGLQRGSLSTLRTFAFAMFDWRQ